MKARYYAHTLPGFEPIVWLEMRQRLKRAVNLGQAFAEEKNGIVFFDCADDPAQLHRLLCTTEDVFITIAHEQTLTRDYKDVRAIARTLSDSPQLADVLRIGSQLLDLPPRTRPSLRLVTRKTGDHAYRRLDVETAARKAVQGRLGPTVSWVDDGADLEIWINVLGPLLLIGLRLSGREMRHRNYKRAHLPASLRPTAAAAMVLLSAPQPHECVLDLMCGAGTLAAERLALGPARVFAGDLVPQALHAARQNGLGNIVRWDALHLPLPAACTDKVLCNPPFGKQLGDKRQLPKLYAALLRETARVLKPGGKAVFVTSAHEVLRDALRTSTGLRTDRGYAVALLGEWGRIYLLTRE